MKINFRQGLISFQQSGPIAVFLVQSAVPGYIDLSVTPTPFIGTIAHGSSDYLLNFDTSIIAAWGPISSGVDTYLYFDLNLITGNIIPGSTTLEPITSSIEPSAPVFGQMWFDTVAKVYKVRDPNNTKWIVAPRLVVGKTSGSINQIVPYSIGTSVELNEPGNPGYLIFDSQLRPVRTSTGELLSSDSQIHLKTTVGTAGVLATPVNAFIPVRADEPIPAMRLVYFTSADGVSLASSDPALTINKNPVGLIQQALAESEIGSITQTGEITYDQWAWSPADYGKPLYCGFHGEVTTTRPLGAKVFRIGYVKNANSIILGIDSEVYVPIVSEPGSLISGIAPISAITALNINNEVVTTISISPADATHDGYMSIAQAQLLLSLDSRLTTAEGEIVVLQNTKSDIGHHHLAAEIDDFADAVDSLLVAGNQIDIQYDNLLKTITISSTASTVLSVKESDGVGYNIIHQASDGLGINKLIVSEPTPGLIALQPQDLEIYEGTTLKATYPNNQNLTLPTQLVFGSGLTVITSGLYDQIITITAPSVHFLNDLDDVDLQTTAPIAGNALIFNGTAWVPGASSGGGAQVLNDLTDVTIAAPFDGDVLRFNNTSSQWENMSISQVPVINI